MPSIFLWYKSPNRAQAASFLRFLDQTWLHTHTHTYGNTPLNERSVRLTDRYLHNTERTQETNIHALRGIRTHDPSNRVASYLRLRRCWNWPDMLSRRTVPIIRGTVSVTGRQYKIKHVVNTLRIGYDTRKSVFAYNYVLNLSTGHFKEFISLGGVCAWWQRILKTALNFIFLN
jgi:hypothetical protein